MMAVTGLSRDLQADIRQNLAGAEPDMEMLDVKRDMTPVGGAAGAAAAAADGRRPDLRGGGLNLVGHGTHHRPIGIRSQLRRRAASRGQNWIASANPIKNSCMTPLPGACHSGCQRGHWRRHDRNPEQDGEGEPL